MTLKANGAHRTGRLTRIALIMGPSFVGLYVCATLGLVFVIGDRDVYYAILEWWGIMPYHYPFVDIKIVLTAIDCARQGVDVYTPNTCMFGGWYSYSPILLWLGKLSLGPDDHMWIGVLLGIAFLISLAALPPSATRNECLIRCLATLSTVTVFGVERTEFDIVIFVIIVAGLAISQNSNRIRFSLYGTILAATVLKYYPIVVFILAARERFKTAFWIAFVAFMATGGFLAGTLAESGKVLELTPVGSPFTDYFGARNVPLGISLVAPPPKVWSDDAILRIPFSPAGLLVLGLLFVLVGWTIRRSIGGDIDGVAALPEAERTFLIAGCVLMVGCFFAVQNAGPRAIFLLLTLPGLLAMARISSMGRRPMALICCVLFLMWEGLFRHLALEVNTRFVHIGPLNFFYWLAREIVWWWVMARLGSLIIAFLCRSPATLTLGRIVAGGFSRISGAAPIRDVRARDQ